MIILASGETLGARVRRLRRARGWSQSTLARQAGVNRANVSLWECDRCRPVLASMRRVATALGCDVMDLLN